MHAMEVLLLLSINPLSYRVYIYEIIYVLKLIMHALFAFYWTPQSKPMVAAFQYIQSSIADVVFYAVGFIWFSTVIGEIAHRVIQWKLHTIVGFWFGES